MSRSSLKQNSYWGAIISLGIVLMIVFVFGQLPNNGVSSPAQGGYPVPDRPVSPSALPTQGGYPGPDRLASPTSVPATASLEKHMSSETTEAQWLATHAPWKLPSAEMKATLAAEATALSQLPPIDKYSTPVPRPTLPPHAYLQRAAGAGRIIEEITAMHMQTAFISTNAWIEKTADKYILVWAGYKRHTDVKDTPLAAVVVEWRSLSTHELLPGTGGMFLTPEKVSAVVIVDATGEELTLRAADGTTFYFNVASQKYISHRPTLPAPRQVGQGVVIENGEAPFSQPGFRFWNQWTRQTGNQRLTAFAGIEGGNNTDWWTGQNVLALVSSRAEPTSADKPEIYYPPDTYGMLMVFDVMDDQLILVSGFGDAFVFDLNTRRFLTRAEILAERKLPLAPLFDDGTSSLPIK